ncbi:casein kinase 2 regulatory subunit [Rhodotorula toruloides]
MARTPADPDRALAATYPDDSAPQPADAEEDTAGATGEAMHDDELEDDEEEEEQQELYESSSSPSTETDTLTWINWFCSLPGHEYFCEVAEDFIEDDFNLTGLIQLVPFYKEAMEMILDVEPEDDEGHRVPDVSIVESSAELLYGLIHQRYILTRQGLQQMYAKFDAAHFGVCPRVYCGQTKLVPCGRSDLPGVDTVKLFCPSCLDMYVPPSSRFQGVDGAFFGTTFPHLLFQTYPPPSPFPAPQLAPSEPSKRVPTTPSTSLSKIYQPRIYGFRVSERAKSGPRMMWMRMRPRTEGELDWDERLVGGDAGAEGGGGEGEGALFDDDNIDDEEEESEEEEEEEGGAGGGEGGKNTGGAGKQAAPDKMVENVASALDEASLTSPRTNATSPSVMRTTPLPIRTDREIKPLPTSRRSSPAAASAPTAASAQAAATASTTSRTASEAASASLAASIQRHLAAPSDLPLPPPPLPTAPARRRDEMAGAPRVRVA